MKILNQLAGNSLRRGTNASGRAKNPRMAVVDRSILNNLNNPPAIKSGNLGI